MRLLFFFLLSLGSYASQMAIDFFDGSGVTQGFRGEDIFKEIWTNSSAKSQKAYRKSTYYYWGDSIDHTCQLKVVGEYEVFETPDSYIVNVLMDAPTVSKLYMQKVWPVLSRKVLPLLRCDKTFALDFKDFSFSSQRQLASTLILEYRQGNQIALILPREFGGVERFQSWRQDNSSDFSILMGNITGKGKFLNNGKTFLVPGALSVKMERKFDLPLLVSNFEEITKNSHHSFVRIKKENKAYSFIGISEIKDKSEVVSHFNLLNTVTQLVKKLREKSDLIIVVGIMSDELRNRLKKIKGVDFIVFQGSEKLHQEPERAFKMAGRKGLYHRSSVEMISCDWKGVIRFVISSEGNQFRLNIKHHILDDRIAARKNYFEGFFVADKKQGGILPPRPTLKPIEAKYSMHEIAYLVANSLVANYQVDVALAYPYEKMSSGRGAISTVVFKQWLPPVEKWIFGKMSGEELLSLKSDQYAVGGMLEGKIGDVPIRPYFLYKVMIPLSRKDEFSSFISSERRAIDITHKLLKYIKSQTKSELEKMLTSWQRKPFARWSFYLEKVALELSSNSRKNGNAFSESSDSEVSAPSSTLIGIDFQSKLRLDYRSSVSELGFSALYKSSKIDDSTAAGQRNILADDWKLWLSQSFPWARFWNIRSGPFAKILFDSEFSPTVTREEVFNGQIGWKLFDGKYLSELFLAPFWESDLSDKRSLFGGVMGVSGMYKTPYGILRGNASFKYYLGGMEALAKDLKHLIKFEVSYESKLFGRFSLAPFFKILHYKNRLSGTTGQQEMLGIKLNFNQSWLLN